MASTKTLVNLVQRTLYSTRSHRRLLHQTSTRHAITNLEMPAMSPTMTEGGIAGWKKKDGETFTAGDVLLEIETDKATIDVEAQDDGIMGKILLQDGTKSIPVGKVIALLAEEGDNISNLQPPKEDTAAPKQDAPSPPSPPPDPAGTTSTTSPTPPQSPSTIHVSHSRPLFPSVHRLLLEFGITRPEQIKGTGVRGMLTKGDVLAHLGKASGPSGTYKESPSPPRDTINPDKTETPKPLDGPAIRRLIVSTMLKKSVASRDAAVAPTATADFDSVIADYLPHSTPRVSRATPSAQSAPKSAPDYLDGLY